MEQSKESYGRQPSLQGSDSFLCYLETLKANYMRVNVTGEVIAW